MQPSPQGGLALGLTPYLSAQQLTSRTPWGVQLAGGERCAFLQGTGAEAVSGVRIYFQCGHGQIVGDIDRAGSLWSANYLAQGATTTRRVPVRTAWF